MVCFLVVLFTERFFELSPFFDLVLFPLPLHLLIALGMCFLDSGVLTTFASRSKVGV